MEIDLMVLLHKSAPLLVFVVLLLGYILGKLRFGSFELGSTSGVLLIGLLFGHFGLTMPVGLADVGFILFIFCVGLQAGPRFFSVFLEDGSKYILLAGFVAGSALIMTKILAHYQGIDDALAAGMLAGIMTSTPTLVGAQDAIKQLAPQNGQSMVEMLSVGYAMTYIMGTVLLIIALRYFPKLFGVNLKQESDRLAIERGLTQDNETDLKGDLPIVRVFRVEGKLVEQFDGKTLRQIDLHARTGCLVDKIRRNGSIFEPDGDTPLLEGDSITLVGKPRDFRKFPYELGKEILDTELLDYQVEYRKFVLTNQQLTGKTLGDLAIDEYHHCFVHRVKRSQIEMPINSGLKLSKGDELLISGERARLERLGEQLGYEEKHSHTTDLITFTLGIVFGLLIGQIIIKVGNIDVTLGNAGGLLFSGIMIGHFRANHPTFGQVPPAAIYVLSELGLMFFMANIGLKAGGGIVEAMMAAGGQIIMNGMLIELSLILLAYCFGRFLLGLNKALLLGAITGAMTSTPALNIITEEADSNIPSLGYAGTYTFANVFLTLVGTIMIVL
ncbi:aspartate-alanine antiporter-like transporter [Endozoicomonadaceae bacterium StTr2]